MNARAFATLAQALAHIDVDDAILTVPPGLTRALAVNTTVPANVALQPRGGLIDLAGFDLTIEGEIAGGPVPLFIDTVGGGTVTITGVQPDVWSAWFGHTANAAGVEADAIANDAALTAAMNAGPPIVRIHRGDFPHLFPRNPGVSVIGAGRFNGTRLFLPDDCLGVNYNLVRGLGFVDSMEDGGWFDLEYDGNESGNRGWIAAGKVFGDLRAEGITAGTNGTPGMPGTARVPPKRFSARRVHVHDCVRSCIVWGTPAVPDLDEVLVGNSIADHLVYGSGEAGGHIGSIELYGFWRATAWAASGENMSSLVARDYAANPHGTYVLTGIVSPRSGEGRLAKIDSAQIEINPDLLTRAFFLTGDCMIGKLRAEQVADSDGDFVMFDMTPDSGAGDVELFSVGSYKIEGVRADHFKLLHIAASTGHITENVDLRGGRINYRSESPADNDVPLLHIRSELRGLLVDGLDVRGAGTRFLTTNLDHFVTGVVRRVTMLDGHDSTGGGSAYVGLGGNGLHYEDCRFADPGTPRFSDSQLSARQVTLSRVTIATDARGTSTQDGDGTTKVFTIAHGLGATPSFFSVLSVSTDASETYVVTADATNLTITFAGFESPPPVGTGNLVWEWEAYVGKGSDGGGQATFSGTGAAVNFSIPHGMFATPKVVSVIPASSAARGDFHVTVTSTNIVVSYAVAPASGTDNVVLWWRASRSLPQVAA